MLVQTHEHRGFHLHIEEPPSRIVAYTGKSSPQDLIQSLTLLGMRQATAQSLSQHERKAILNLISYGKDYRKEPTACENLIAVYQAPAAQRYRQSGAPEGSDISLEVHIQTLLDDTFPLHSDDDELGQDIITTPPPSRQVSTKKAHHQPQLSRLERLLETPPSAKPVIFRHHNHKHVQRGTSHSTDLEDEGDTAIHNRPALTGTTQCEDDDDSDEHADEHMDRLNAISHNGILTHQHSNDVSNMFLTLEEQSTIHAASALLKASMKKRSRE